MMKIKTLIFLFLMSFAGTVTAQEDIKAVINWEASPADQKVEWYVIRWDMNRDGNVSNMPIIAETNQTNYELDASFFQLVEGKEICVVIIAARGNERSVPSEPGCVIYTKQGDTTVLIPLTPVTGVTIELNKE